ncbi:MAG: HesA/MoeB/ThiF family protein [Armatimonadota bacterium]
MADDLDLDITLEGGDEEEPASPPEDAPVQALDVNMEDDRYSRFRLIPWWNQELLRRTRILVIGAGALGNEIVKNLALLGIGHVLVCDMDRIENSNLSRSILFRRANEGEYKAEVIARAAREINPDVNAHPFVGNVLHDVGLGIFRAFDVVIGGLDNREARLHINQCCWKVNKPWVDGAIEVVSGMARVFTPPDGACYECTMNAIDFEMLARRKSCSLLTRDQMLEGKVPTTPTTSSVIAGIQCQEAVKLVHRKRELPVLAGKGFFFNGMTLDTFVIEYQRKEDCLSHDTYETIEEMPWTAAGTTVREVVEAVHARLGKEAVVELEREIVSTLECRPCGTSQPIYQPLVRLSEGMARCPGCGEVRWPNLTHSLEADAPYADSTLAEIGIPPLDIITGRVGFDRIHFELTGDRPALLGWMEETAVAAKG